MSLRQNLKTLQRSSNRCSNDRKLQFNHLPITKEGHGNSAPHQNREVFSTMTFRSVLLTALAFGVLGRIFGEFVQAILGGFGYILVFVTAVGCRSTCRLGLSFEQLLRQPRNSGLQCLNLLFFILMILTTISPVRLERTTSGSGGRKLVQNDLFCLHL